MGLHPGLVLGMPLERVIIILSLLALNNKTLALTPIKSIKPHHIWSTPPLTGLWFLTPSFFENLSRAEPIWCFYVVVKAPNLCGEQLMSIPDVYKVFWHLDMLRMSIWVHSYAVIHVRMTVNFIRKNRARLGLCDDVMKWLGLQPFFECIPHPYWMYTKWCSTLMCCGWTLYGFTYCDTLLQVLGGGGVDLSPCDIVMSLLRLQQASDCIPHPYWMYIKPFGTLICCVWAYGATLTGMHLLCRPGVDFGVLGARMML